MPREFISRYTRDLTSRSWKCRNWRPTVSARDNTRRARARTRRRSATRRANLAFTMSSPALPDVWWLAFSVIGPPALAGFCRSSADSSLVLRQHQVPAPVCQRHAVAAGRFLLMNLLVLLVWPIALAQADLSRPRNQQGHGLTARSVPRPAFGASPRTRWRRLLDTAAARRNGDRRAGDVAGKASPAALLMALFCRHARARDEAASAGARATPPTRRQPSRAGLIFIRTWPYIRDRRCVRQRSAPLLRRQNGSIERG